MAAKSSMREAIVVAGLESPVHYAAGVDLARLARIVSGGADVPTIIAAYQDNVGPCRSRVCSPACRF